MKEAQYEALKVVKENYGLTSLGIMSNQVWIDDPKRLLFNLSRYKFVAKILRDYSKVLEVGCGDAFASRIVKQHVKELVLSDFDDEFLSDVLQRQKNDSHLEVRKFDPTQESFASEFEGIYALDVIEHIPASRESEFLQNLKRSLATRGVLVLGTPSLESQLYASEQSKQGHVNCKSAKDWRELLMEHFSNVFQFGMNDEVVHTGFDEMCHYLFFICVK